MKGATSRRRLRFRLQWRAIVVLAGVWVVLWGNYSLVDLLVGLGLAWLITVTFPLPPIRYHGRLHPIGLIVLAAALLRDLAVASWRLSLAAFSPRVEFRPAVVRLQLQSNSDLYQVETAEIISIVPGSIVIDARRSARVLYLHLLDVAEEDGVAKAKEEALAVERRVLRALGSKAEIAALRRKGEQS